MKREAVAAEAVRLPNHEHPLYLLTAQPVATEVRRNPTTEQVRLHPPDAFREHRRSRYGRRRGAPRDRSQEAQVRRAGRRCPGLCARARSLTASHAACLTHRDGQRLDAVRAHSTMPNNHAAAFAIIRRAL